MFPHICILNRPGDVFMPSWSWPVNVKSCQKALALRGGRLFSLADGRRVRNNVRARRGDKGEHAAQLGGTAVISAALHPLMIWRKDHTGGPGGRRAGGGRRPALPWFLLRPFSWSLRSSRSKRSRVSPDSFAVTQRFRLILAIMPERGAASPKSSPALVFEVRNECASLSRF